MQNTLKSRVTGVSHILITIGVFLVVLMVVALGAGELLQAVTGMNLGELRDVDIASMTESQSVVLRVFQSATGISLIITAVICTLMFRVQFWQFTGLRVSPRLSQLGMAVVLFLALTPTITWLIQWNAEWSLPDDLASRFRDLEDTSNHLYERMLAFNTGSHFWLNLLIMCLIPAIGEELFFRGIFMRVATNWSRNIHVGVLMSAVFFALVHFQPYKIIPMIFLGMLFGYLYYLTRSLWVPILLHGFNNSLVVIADRAQKTGEVPEMMSNDYTFSFVQVVIPLIIAIALFTILWKTSKHADLTYE